MPSRVDLHTHTTASDGTMSPEALLRLAEHLEIRCLSITDHDSLQGYHQAKALLDATSPLQLIPGIEINAQGPRSCHILGYFINPDHDELNQKLQQYQKERLLRLEEMTRRTQALGIAITFEDVVLAGKDAVSLGRPHLADALVARGIVRSRQEAFDRFLKKGGPSYVESTIPTPSEAIALVRKAGGVPILAHPSYYLSDGLIDELQSLGILGMEVYYPEHSRSLIQRYLELAASHGLVVTGGSDFHGPKTGRNSLACVDVPESIIPALLKACDRLS